VKKEGSGDGEKMDKQGKQISIKINGSERPFTTEKMPVSSAAKNEICAAKEEEEALFSNVENKESSTDNNIVDFEDLRKSAVRKTKKKSFNSTFGKQFKSAFVSIFTAVVVGTGFGFIVLNFISDEKANVVLKEGAVSSSDSALPQQSIDTKEKPIPALGENSSFSVHVIQAGVFTTPEAARAHMRKLNESHIPAVAVGKNPTYLFIGIGLEKEALRPISELYNQKGQATYIKPLTFEMAADSKTKKVLEASQYFYEQLISSSVQLLGGNSSSNEIWEDLQKEYKRFQSIDVPSDQNAAEYKKHIETAYLLLTSYQQTKDMEALFKAQQELLEALTAYLTKNR
jgi:stage II sporulation protein B